jgi:hypothetical protein
VLDNRWQPSDFLLILVHFTPLPRIPECRIMSFELTASRR